MTIQGVGNGFVVINGKLCITKKDNYKPLYLHEEEMTLTKIKSNSCKID